MGYVAIIKGTVFQCGDCGRMYDSNDIEFDREGEPVCSECGYYVHAVDETKEACDE